MYKAKQFNLSGLRGILDQTLEMHFKLYEGYVEEFHAARRQIEIYGEAKETSEAYRRGIQTARR